MKAEEYRKIITDDIAVSAELNSTDVEQEFLSYVTERLIEGEEFDDFTECHCEGITRRKGNYAIDGYCMDETDGSCCIFAVDYHGDYDSVINGEDVTSAFRKIRFFVEESIKNELFRDLDNKAAKDFARDLYYDNEEITKFRFYLITDAYNHQRSKTIKDETINDRIVELNVWDIERLSELVSSQTMRESVEIKFDDFGVKGIPCVKAVAFENIVADIETAQQYGDDGKVLPPAEGENIVSYSSYLAVVPGTILNTLYLDYGAKLLEGNVRSFLSAKGKVNRGIQGTIKNYPEMFFAYNNGIAATASEIKTEITPDGPVITYIRDLQIVNGGQTTASIANAVLAAKKGENIRLDKIFVPMKLSVLDHSTSEKIIPKISEYSNSQNKVEASDFFSNHPFHIRMEGISKKTPCPNHKGNQFQQYWFYERARGQYNQGKMKYTGKPAELKKYNDKYPEEHVIKMLDLAKMMVIYGQRPDIASKGKQKTLQTFAGNIKTKWTQSDEWYNEAYFKRVVVLTLMYKETDRLVRESQWYKETHSYKANVIAYSMSVLFYYIAKNCPGYTLDFQRIWNAQEIYPELSDQLRVLTDEVHNFITGARNTENVTEWCKQEACWNNAKNQVWTIHDDFIETLMLKTKATSQEKTEKEKQKISNEIDAITEIQNRGQDYWKSMKAWGIDNKVMDYKANSILTLTINMFSTKMPISLSQAKYILDLRKTYIKNGMPLEF